MQKKISPLLIVVTGLFSLTSSTLPALTIQNKTSSQLDVHVLKRVNAKQPAIECEHVKINANKNKTTGKSCESGQVQVTGKIAKGNKVTCQINNKDWYPSQGGRCVYTVSGVKNQPKHH